MALERLSTETAESPLSPVQGFKYIYGPVESWRMGRSLGIDPVSDKQKICNLNCIYCQLGRTNEFTNIRKVYVPTEEILKEIDALPPILDIDYFTFSGRGEPTLASNLGEMIRALKGSKRQDIAVITNSTLMYLKEVRESLLMSDLVIAKLDACDELSFSRIDHSMRGLSFEKVLYGIKSFRDEYRGKLAVQVMFVEENRKDAVQIAKIVRSIAPDEIQINTPLRPSAAKPLNREGILEIKKCFAGMPAVSIYERERKETIPMDKLATIKRHGNYTALS